LASNSQLLRFPDYGGIWQPSESCCAPVEHATICNRWIRISWLDYLQHRRIRLQYQTRQSGKSLVSNRKPSKENNFAFVWQYEGSMEPGILNGIDVNPYSDDTTVGYSGAFEGLRFYPGHRNSSGTIISEPYWELSSYDPSTFQNNQCLHWSSLQSESSFTQCLPIAHHSSIDSSLISTDSQLQSYNGEACTQSVS
jgi:hypothetical protein